MSKNAFSDLGFSDDYASEMALRVALAVQIRRVMAERELNQQEAARLFGVPQPTISKVKRLQLQNISLALLARMLFKAAIPFSLHFGGSSQDVSASVDVKGQTRTVMRDWNMGAAGAAGDAAPAEQARVEESAPPQEIPWNLAPQGRAH